MTAFANVLTARKPATEELIPNKLWKFGRNTVKTLYNFKKIVRFIFFSIPTFSSKKVFCMMDL